MDHRSPESTSYWQPEVIAHALANTPSTPQRDPREGDEIDENAKQASEDAEAVASKKAAKMIMDTKKKIKSKAARDKLRESAKCKGKVRVIG